MPSTTVLARSQEPRPTSPLLWLWEITLAVEESPGNTIVARLVANPEPITVGGKTFHPFPVSQSPYELTADGDLPTLSLSVDNRTRWLTPWLRDGNAFLGRRVKLWIVDAGSLPATLSLAEPFTFQIAELSVTAEAATFRLQIESVYQIQVPEDRFSPRRCRWDFGGPECGYLVNSVAAFTTCGKLVADCIARGLDEAARGIPVRHPRRFGGFRGVAVSR